MSSVPDFATHYYLSSRRPLQNLSDLADDDAVAVMAQLEALRLEGGQHRRFGLPYLAMRRETERRLREAFIADGGRPERRAPHYFVLGTSEWFRGLALGMAEVSVLLSALEDGTASVTYGDSFEAMRVAAEAGFGGTGPDQPYHSRTFRLEEIPMLLDRFGWPDTSADDDYTGYERRSGERFIEIQVWSDRPVRHLLAFTPE